MTLGFPNLPEFLDAITLQHSSLLVVTTNYPAEGNGDGVQAKNPDIAEEW
jgi:hypothetical protein